MVHDEVSNSVGVHSDKVEKGCPGNIVRSAGGMKTGREAHSFCYVTELGAKLRIGSWETAGVEKLCRQPTWTSTMTRILNENISNLLFSCHF